MKKWYPEIANRLKITLIEALPNVLPAFSKQLIQYTESTFKENKIDVLTRTMVKDVKEKSVVVQDANKEIKEIPYGLLVWATGNTSRTITRNLMAKLPQAQTQRRGLLVDDYMSMLGADGVYALGDCTATQYAPTAQAASQQGIYLAQTFNKLGNKAKLEKELAQLRASPDAPTKAEQIEATLKKLNRVSKLSPFHYSHQVRSDSRCTGNAPKARHTLWINSVLIRIRVRSRTLVRRRPLPTCPSSVVTSPRAVVPPTSSGDLPTS